MTNDTKLTKKNNYVPIILCLLVLQFWNDTLLSFIMIIINHTSITSCIIIVYLTE